MQLILETESTLDIQRDMSTIEEPLNEKVIVNGDAEDLIATKCNGSKENLVDGDIITAGKESRKVQIIDNHLTKTLAKVDDILLNRNDEGLEKSECEPVINVNLDEDLAQNSESDAPIRESCDNSPNEDVNINNSDINHVSEEVNEEMIEDDIISIKDTNIAGPNILDNTQSKTENNIKESLVGKEDNINSISQEIASVSNDDIINIDDKLKSVHKDGDFNNLNETQACDALTKDTDEATKEQNKIDADGAKIMDNRTTNENSEIPDLSDDVEKMEPIELNDVMNVEEVPVKPNNRTCVVVDLDKDQGKSEPVSSEDKTNTVELTDGVNEKTCDVPNEVISVPLVSHVKVEVEGLNEAAEEKKSEISNSIQNTQTNKVTEQSAPNNVCDKTDEDAVECVSEEIKNNNCCKFKFPTLDENAEESAIEVQDEMDVEEIKVIQEGKGEIKDVTTSQAITTSSVTNISEKPVLCKLSNTLDILSDDDEEPPRKECQVKEVAPQIKVKETACIQQQSINIEDDDDIMLIDEDLPTETVVKYVEKENNNKIQAPMTLDSKIDMESGEDCHKQSDSLFSNINEKESTLPVVPIVDYSPNIDIKEKTTDKETENREPEKPLLPENFLLSAKKNLADMNREDLEEFCILKIVESIVDRSSLSDIKAKLKAMAQSIEEYRKKAMMLTKQNRDLQVVLKSVQEEQKKMTDLPIAPLKITRSVGMQVLMTDKMTARRKAMLGQVPANAVTNNTNRHNTRPAGPSPRMQKPTASNQSIPVPRLVPANIPAIKSPSTVPTSIQANTPGKTVANPVPNGIKNLTPVQKSAEKRQHNRIQSVTVDLTDDEPPAKINPRNSPAPPVRLVPPQNLMAPQRPFTPAAVNSPRKVYIPISGPQNQSIRPGQTIMLKPVTGTRPRCNPPQPQKVQNPVRRVTSGRHPAPLPDAMKQYQPPNWKALPPAPDLRLSKVENGIVISWKIEGYQEDSYEEIASYQLYAYQETTSPPSTHLWKKIGDVKALPLPMACTLTQFMAGFKYYFAVRAVDVKSRLGPFSLPGSILLLNKL